MTSFLKKGLALAQKRLIRVLFAWVISTLCVVGITERQPTLFAAEAIKTSPGIMEKLSQAIEESRKRVRRLVPTNRDTQKPASQEPGLTQASRDLTKDSEKIYRRRSSAFRESHELAQGALVLDPNNRRAKEQLIRIDNDLDRRVTDYIPKGIGYRPPEATFAFKVAMSDDILTIEEAVEIALKASVMIRSLQKKIDSSRSKLWEAQRALWPTMSGEISVNGGILSSTPYSGEAFKLNFSQPMYYGGELLATIKQAQATIESDVVKLKKEKLELAYKVKEAYRNVVNAEYNLKLQAELSGEIETIKKRTDAAYAKKLVPEIEHLEVDSIHNQTDFQRISAENTLKVSRLTLAELLGVEIEAAAEARVADRVEAKKINLPMPTLLTMIQEGNPDIRIKKLAEEIAYYAVKVFDAQKHPRVDVRGSTGWQGEVALEHSASPDIEKEHFIGVNVAMPVFGPNTAEYKYQRRFFGPTISSFQGSEDFKHTWTVNLLDRISNQTDEENARSEYLKAKAELEKERLDQQANGMQGYYDYLGALLQIQTGQAKIRFRERQVAIFKHLVAMEETKITELMNELVTLIEDRYGLASSAANAMNSLANMDRLAGAEQGYFELLDGEPVVTAAEPAKSAAETQETAGSEDRESDSKIKETNENG